MFRVRGCVFYPFPWIKHNWRLRVRAYVVNDEFPVLSRPFINALDNSEARELISSPGTQPGDIDPLGSALARKLGLSTARTAGVLTEIVRRSPTVLVDAAHNPAGVEALAEAMRLGAEGRVRHTAATRELVALTKEAGRLVRAMERRVDLDHVEARGVARQMAVARAEQMRMPRWNRPAGTADPDRTTHGV